MQVKFFEVSEEELEKQRAAFATGQLQLDMTEEQFDMAAYNRFLADVAPEADKLKEQQQAASAKQVGFVQTCICYLLLFNLYRTIVQAALNLP